MSIPNMSYWTTSGGFVFVTILAGAGSVAAAFVGSFVFELLRSFAFDILPGTWQMLLGAVLLLTILFLPEGLGSLFARLRRRRDAGARHHERDPRRPRSGKDLRLARRRARHQRRGAAAADRRHHRRQRRRQDHLHQHDHRPSAAEQGHDLVRGPRHHRPAFARDHPARHLALVPGGADLSLADRVREHVRRGRDRARRRRACRRRRSRRCIRRHTIAEAEAALELFRIARYRHALAATLPQGVRKLLDIAMAVAGSPRVLLLDEPTSGISIEEKFDLMDVVMSALKSRSITVLFVEHDMEIVERFADRVLAFYDGTVIADGTPAGDAGRIRAFRS